MNILFVSAVLPYPLHSGGQIRIYNLLKELSKQHTITLCSFIRHEDERQEVKHLDFLHDVKLVMRGRGMQPKYIIRSLLGDIPMLLATYDNPEMKSCITAELRDHRYDLIHIEPFYVYPSLPDLHIPLVISEHNVEYEVYRSNAERQGNPFMRYIQLRDAEKLQRWETDILRLSAHTVAVSSDDAKILSTLAPHVPVTVVSNGVDTDWFSYVKKTFHTKRKSFVFVGNFLWIPNREILHSLLEQIWPAIRTRYQDAVLHIVGGSVPVWATGHASDHVIFDGVIPDVRKAYADADAIIAPLTISGGTKFKILEAMAAGCPVITTDEGIHGIDGNIRQCVKIASTPDAIVAEISHMYEHPAESLAMCERARKLVTETYSWQHIATSMESVWKGSIS